MNNMKEQLLSAFEAREIAKKYVSMDEALDKFKHYIISIRYSILEDILYYIKMSAEFGSYELFDYNIDGVYRALSQIYNKRIPTLNDNINKQVYNELLVIWLENELSKLGYKVELKEDSFLKELFNISSIEWR